MSSLTSTPEYPMHTLQRSKPFPVAATSSPRRSWWQRRIVDKIESRPVAKVLTKSPTTLQSLKAIVIYSWTNAMVVFMLVSWILHFRYAGEKDTLIFIFSFLGIIPLANLFSLGTEELCGRFGSTIAGILNAALGNVVELIVAVLALFQCELRVVQASLVGSILSNLLLVLGTCFLAGGYRFEEQGLSFLAIQITSSLLVVAFMSMALPVGYVLSSQSIAPHLPATDVLKICRAIAVILILGTRPSRDLSTGSHYAASLCFQLLTHNKVYSVPLKSTRYKAKSQPLLPRSNTEPTAGDDDEPHVMLLNLPVLVVFLIVTTVLVGFTSEWLVRSIDGLTASGTISKEFVGLILLPLVGNAAEHASAVTVAVKDNLPLSFAVAAGSSIQIAFFVFPVTVIIGWFTGKPMTFVVDPLELFTLFAAGMSLWMVNCTVQDGKANWMEGLVLVVMYLMIAIVFWFYPGTDLAGALFGC
ncbi:calcium proton exchanger [Mycena floridula]|nr:calcium proton exchanger [Mycena floridula]